MELWIAFSSITISLLSLIVVIKQVRISTKAVKSQISVGLIHNLYKDKDNQNLLLMIYNKNIKSNPTMKGFVEKQSDKNESKPLIFKEIDALLNQFQIIGHLLSLKIINKRDLNGLEYEILAIGRNYEIREYFKYLNVEYQIKSGIRHDHFKYFKDLYLLFEYDKNQIKSFNDYNMSIQS